MSPLCDEPMEHHLVPLVPLSHPSASIPCLPKRGLSRGAHHCPGGEDLHHTGLGALAAGLIVLHHEVAGQLPGDVGEAAGGRWVRANCGGRAKMVISSGKGWGEGNPKELGLQSPESEEWGGSGG